jgi:superfamily II DNA or RNA helicase
MDLFRYQVPHVESLERALLFHNVALDASDLGTGKTVCACAVAKRLEKELIVVCKKVMIPTWRLWMEKWEVSGIAGNWELARVRGLPSRKGALYCFDECHEGGGFKTLNAKLLVNTFEAGHMMLLLSATAIESPMKMWALGYLLHFHNLRDFYKWMFKNGVVKNYGYGGHRFNGSKKVLQNIHSHIFPERGSRMRKEEIPDFPECQIIVEQVLGDPTHTELKKWFDMIAARELIHENKVADSDKPWSAEGEILPELLFSRMRAELSKVLALIELAKEGRAEGYHVVIFVNFITTLQALENHLNLEKEEMIWGDQTAEERNYVIDRFQLNATPILCSTIDSGGAGIDLHDVHGGHPRLALVCPTWRAVTLRQALGRVHRAGAKTKAIQKLVYLGEGIEARVAERVASKLEAIDTINDHDLSEEGEFSLTKSAE